MTLTLHGVADASLYVQAYDIGRPMQCQRHACITLVCPAAAVHGQYPSIDLNAAYQQILRHSWCIYCIPSKGHGMSSFSSLQPCSVSLQMSVLKRCLKAKSDKPIPEALQQLLFAVERAWRLKYVLLADLWALILVPLIFAAFVVWNGGIVLGDKTAHTPVKHLMQPLYFVLFTAVALAPFHFSPAR